MNLRIKFPQGHLVKRRTPKQRELALTANSLIIPVSATAYTLAVWRLAADMGLAPGLGLQGLFSHWQLWMALAVALQFGGQNISRRTMQLARFAQARFDSTRFQLGDKIAYRIK